MDCIRWRNVVSKRRHGAGSQHTYQYRSSRGFSRESCDTIFNRPKRSGYVWVTCVDAVRGNTRGLPSFGHQTMASSRHAGDLLNDSCMQCSGVRKHSMPAGQGSTAATHRQWRAYRAFTLTVESSYTILPRPCGRRNLELPSYPGQTCESLPSACAGLPAHLPDWSRS